MGARGSEEGPLNRAEAASRIGEWPFVTKAPPNKTLAKPPKICSDTVSTYADPKTLNAISPTAALPQAPALTSQDLGILESLIELGMQLAECATRQAVEDSQARSADQQATQPPRPRRPDPNLIFLRLYRLIRDTIIIKTRLAAGILPAEPRPPRQPAAQAATQSEDPRGPHILRYFREAIDLTRQKRKTPITQAQIESRVATELAKDPQHKLQGRVILLSICKSLDLPFYANRMHPDLFRPPQPPS